ncbi:MAG: protein kinase [Deltaproteobacteria bacterium]|nr:protein kinase [Deltaproteobacteria bacterium]
MQSLVGSTVGGYRLVRGLGTGPQGQTYAAEDQGGRAAAVKVLHGPLCLVTQIEAYWAQQQALADLAHPHLSVPSVGAWASNGRFFVARELWPGMDLHEVLSRRARLPASQVLLMAGQVCLALEAVHARGYAHGALKPRNILLVTRGRDGTRPSTRLADFGTAFLLPGAPAAPDQAGSAAFADPAYLAPEQFEGRGGTASDIFALGVICCEAISGRRPWVGSFEQIAGAHARAERELPPNVPPGFDAILARALAHRPEDRFRSVGELRSALEAWAATKPSALEEPPLDLLSKENGPSGVAHGQDRSPEDTVRVSLEDLSKVIEQRVVSDFFGEAVTNPRAKESATVGTTEKREELMPAMAGSEGKRSEEEELAALAEQAAAPLRSARKSGPAEAVPSATRSGAGTKSSPAPVVEAFVDENDEVVELPQERSVRAFVAKLSPTIPPTEARAAKAANGESLDAALDRFVIEAKSWSNALPRTAFEDQQLAELARIPVAAPATPPPGAAMPTPAASAAPMTPAGTAPAVEASATAKSSPSVAPPSRVTAAPPLAATVATDRVPAVTATLPSQSPRRSLLGVVLISFLLGGGLVLLGVKLLMKSPEPPATPSAGTSAAASPSTAPAPKEGTGNAPAPAAAGSPSAGTATPAPGTAAPAAAGSAGETGGAATGAADATAPAPAAEGTAKAAATAPEEKPEAKPDAKEASAEGSAAAEGAPPAPKTEEAAPPKAKVAKVRKPRRAAAPRPAAVKKPAAKAKKGSGDWVDPFSQ